jgi:hypothetical protein
VTLRFIAKDPNTNGTQCPAALVDEDTAELVLQGWKADDTTEDQCRQFGPLPESEAVIRIPARMVPIISD